jgi:hypothetical protein
MVMLATVEVTKDRLNIDTDDDDAKVGGYIEAASASVIRHLKDQADVLLDLDTGGDLTTGSVVPAEIETATIILVGYWYRNPDGDPDKDFEGDELPRPVKAILKMLRDPTLA